MRRNLLCLLIGHRESVVGRETRPRFMATETITKFSCRRCKKSSAVHMICALGSEKLLSISVSD